MTDIDKVKKLRLETGVSIIECKKALESSKGDLEKAKEILRKWGEKLANKKQNREASQGIIESYIHPNRRIGVLLELGCETDFVAHSKDFNTLAHNLVLHIAAMNPLYIRAKDIPPEVLDREKEIYKAQFAKLKKPQNIIEKMIEGKLNKYKESVCLLSQPFVKEPTKIIQNIINAAVSKLGENIIVKRFIRYEI